MQTKSNGRDFSLSQHTCASDHPRRQSGRTKTAITRKRGSAEEGISQRVAKLPKTSAPSKQLSSIEQQAGRKAAQRRRKKGNSLSRSQNVPIVQEQPKLACSRNLRRTLPWIIGLVSDTHGRFDERLKSVFSEVNEIWHGGDIAGRDGSQVSAEAVLSQLSKIAPVTTVVRGNVDTFAGGLKGHRGYSSNVPKQICDEFPQVAFVSLPGATSAVMTHIGAFPAAQLERRGSIEGRGASCGNATCHPAVQEILNPVCGENHMSHGSVDVVVFGHSHKPGIVEHENVLFINPGSAGPRRSVQVAFAIAPCFGMVIAALMHVRRRFSLPVSAALLRLEIDGTVSSEIVTW